MSKRNKQYPVLENLFNSKIRIKVLKFLFRNYPSSVGTPDLSRRIQEPLEATKKEMRILEKIGLVKKAEINKTHYASNPEFEFFDELKSLILKSSPAEKDKMIKRISGLGRVKLAVATGVFVSKSSANSSDSRVDLFIVGDGINRRKLRSFLGSLEAEVGKEIKFGLMEKDEFEYRYSMFDRFVRVLLEEPHEKLINKLGL